MLTDGGWWKDGMRAQEYCIMLLKRQHWKIFNVSPKKKYLAKKWFPSNAVMGLDKSSTNSEKFGMVLRRLCLYVLSFQVVKPASDYIVHIRKSLL